MSIDDPGWGGDSFGGGSGGSGGSGGWGSPDGKPPGNRPSWLTVPYLAGGAVVLVVVIVVVVLLISRGGSGKPTAKASVSRTPTISISKPASSSPKPSPSPTGETITQYDKLADAVCKKDQPAITAAGTSLQKQYDAQVDEFSDLEVLTSPIDQTEEQEDWIKQLSDSLTDLNKGDETGYQSEIMTANTTAAKLGMTTCNNGY